MDRRNDIKVNVNRSVFIISSDNATGAIRKSKAHLQNISAGGIGIHTRENLSLGDTLELVFDLDRHVDVLPLTVIRRLQLDNGLFSYGCQFKYLHPAQESMVREYVFRRHLDTYCKT